MEQESPTRQADATVTAGLIPSAVDQPYLLPEKQFGSTRLIRRIGSGGMGEVWLARHELLGRDVAIKFLLSAALDRDDPAFQTFIQGAKVAAAVEHPALNKVYHADVADGVPYLVLEFLDGSSLSEGVARCGPLSAAVVRAILEPVCEAVAELHHRDLLHRDIKPSNIMLTVDGRVVLTDFGLARAGPVSALRSNSGGVAGTPAYMAPEMFDGVVSARTDVYAIGMTAYYLLTGKPAFSGSMHELQLQHRTVPINLDPLRAAGVSDAVIDILVRATSKDLLFRPKTARHLLEAFRTAFNSDKIQSASRESVVQLASAEPGRVDHTGELGKAVGELPKTLAEFAARKREQRDSEPKTYPAPAASQMQMRPEEKRRLRAEKRKVWTSLLVAAAAGAGTAVALSVPCIYMTWRIGVWVEIHLCHISETATDKPFTYSDVTPLGARAAENMVPSFAFVVFAVGAAAIVYRLLRGVPLPGDARKTLCGWCGHELRGISAPVCSECGHRIGDRGPDQDRMVPRGRRRTRWVMRFIAVPFVFWFGMGMMSFATAALFHIGVPQMPRTFSHFSILFVETFVATLPNLVLCEWYLRSDLRRSGRAWCRECRSELRELVKPICPTCGTGI